jgi:hypothetical protein
VNGTDYGLHLNLETLDDVFLAHQSTQHLYEGELGDDTYPGGAADFEIDEGSESSTSDLEALISAVQGDTPADFSDRVAGFADLQEMVRMWATEKYIGHWDGYTGVDESFSPNNYYLHSDDSGLFTMIPSGPDQAWYDHVDFGFTGGGILFEKCLEDTSCAELYRQAVKDARDTISGLDLDALATSTASLLAPFQTSDREEYDADQIAQGVADNIAFNDSRPADAATWLGEDQSVPPTDPAHGVEGTSSPKRVAAKKKCKHKKKRDAKSGKCRKHRPRAKTT